MLTVEIRVNGKTVFARSARRRTERHAKGKQQAYLMDCGSVVYHDPDKGILPLAKKMIEEIKDV